MSLARGGFETSAGQCAAARVTASLSLSVTAQAQTDRETDTETDNDAYTNSHTSRTLYNTRSLSLGYNGLYDWTCGFTEPARPHTAAPQRESHGYWLSAGPDSKLRYRYRYDQII